MGLEISSHDTCSPWCRELLAKYKDNMVVQSDVDALLTLSVERAYMAFDDHKHNCRPYMVLVGYPRQLEGQFPFGVTNINYMDDTNVMPVVYRYDMTRNNLAELARKGLYEPDFEIPPIIKNNSFILPCTVSLVGMPADQLGYPPVIFASVESASLRCTDVTSGYCIDEYFRELPLSEEEEEFNNLRKESVEFKQELSVQEDIYKHYQQVSILQEKEQNQDIQEVEQDVQHQLIPEQVDVEEFVSSMNESFAEDDKFVTEIKAESTIDGKKAVDVKKRGRSKGKTKDDLKSQTRKSRISKPTVSANISSASDISVDKDDDNEFI